MAVAATFATVRALSALPRRTLLAAPAFALALLLSGALAIPRRSATAAWSAVALLALVIGKTIDRGRLLRPRGQEVQL
jgi:hypothetical protein